MDIKVDVCIRVDNVLASVLTNLADCWSCAIIAKAGGNAKECKTALAQIPPPTRKEEVPSETPAEEVPNTEEKAVETSPPDEKLSEAELVEIRGKAQAFMKADAENKVKVKTWLNEHNLQRVTEMPKGLLTDFLAFIEGGAA